MISARRWITRWRDPTPSSERIRPDGTGSQAGLSMHWLRTTMRSPQSVMAVLVQAADALSAARPGARRDAGELRQTVGGSGADRQLVPRSWEVICHSGGREIRIVVDSDKVADDGIALLSYDISRRSRRAYLPGTDQGHGDSRDSAVQYAK